MTVYVDDMFRYPTGRFGRMKMSHMIADTEQELHAMATKIGVARKWYQGDHYDISLTKRALAVRYGAQEITWRELAIKLKHSGDSKMARGRKPAKATAAVALSEALDFVSLAQKPEGAIYETHCAITNNWMLGFNGVLSAGCPIKDGDETLMVCPQTMKLKAAINRAGKTLALNYQQENGRLIVKSDKFQAIVPCVTFADLTPINPDPPVAIISDTIRKGLEIVGPIAQENTQHVVTASVLLRSGSVVATDRHLMAEYWHGFDLPTVALPKLFVTALLKIKKPLLRFGFSDNSATFYFEDESWIKTQLYGEPWPDIDRILNRDSKPQPLPKDIANAVAVASDLSDDGFIYFRNKVIASHPSPSAGVEYECNVPGNLSYNAKLLDFAIKHADKIDFNSTDDPDDPILVFFGENLRGTIAGMIYKHELPDEGWSTGKNSATPEPNDIEY